MSDHVEITGEVIQINRDKFRVQIFDGTGQKSESIISAQLSGKMRLNKIRVILGDIVNVKVSAFDTTHGLITSRKK